MDFALEQKNLIREARSFNAKKHLGQHFLVDPNVLKDIAEALNLTEMDTVVEVGPGLGFLTRHLVASGAKVIAVELDQDCVELLSRVKAANLSIKHDDFLAFDLGSLGTNSLKVVGNVPYQITSPILAHIFGEIDKPKAWLRLINQIVLTVQHEVALRLVAEPGTEHYSQITLLTKYFSKAQILHFVPAQSFCPEPSVNSAVVNFVPLSKPSVQCEDTHLLRQLIQAGFRQRRKMFKNNLGFLRFSEGELMALFGQLRLDPQVRAERLSLEQFAQLADIITDGKKVDRCNPEARQK
jgi:16S rRNA (adenine1518-N6/adenine1519-N6)-dimethyltransferase